jgi:hypothetical protein
MKQGKKMYYKYSYHVRKNKEDFLQIKLLLESINGNYVFQQNYCLALGGIVLDKEKKQTTSIDE